MRRALRIAGWAVIQIFYLPLYLCIATIVGGLGWNFLRALAAGDLHAAVLIAFFGIPMLGALFSD